MYNKDDRRRIPLNHKIIDNHVLVLVLDCITTDCHGIRLTLSNTTGARTETGSAYLSDTPAITPIFFCGVLFAQSLVIVVVFCYTDV